MTKSLGLLIVHGMGDTEPGFHTDVVEALRSRLGEQWERIAWRAVFYQDQLQGSQRAILRKMRPDVRWESLRELMLYGFSDAGSLEHKKELPGSPYFRTQRVIVQRLDELFDELGERAAPTAIVAHSLGGHVLSDYIWDAQQPHAFAGVWQDGVQTDEPRGSDRDQFRRLRTLQRFLTTGCNIPVFVAGHNVIEPIARSMLHPDFRWINQYDPDDALGWPLRHLSDGYAALVEDVSVNAGGRTLFEWLKSVTPYSHSQYWSTRGVLDRIADELREMVKVGDR